jgi:copper resistance protein D
MSSLEGPDALSLALRAISFVLLLNAAGIPLFLAFFGRVSQDILPTVARLGVSLAVAALVFVTAHHLLEAARMTGDMTGLTDADMQMTALRSSEGTAFVVRAVGLVCILLALIKTPSAAVGPIGALLVLVSFTLTGHTSVTPHRLIAASLLVGHLLIVVFWLGALWPLYIAATRDPTATGARLVDAFSRTAMALVPLILVAGVCLGALLIPDLSAFKQPYGALLLTKAVLFALLMVLAALNKWRFGPALRLGAARAFRQTVIVEYILICAVLAVTATMTTLYSPEGP